MAATPPTSATSGQRPSSGGGSRSTPVLVPQEALAGQPDIPLNRAVTTVGSSETCRLVLQSRTISRHHAVFLVDNGNAFVADLASRTGVLVNGKPIRETLLNTGDRVQVGKFVFRYRSADGAPPEPTPDAPAASAVVAGLLAVPIHGRIALIGRRETSDVALVADKGVSAAHAALFHAGGQWYVRDLGSRTGTAVNGQAVIQQAVHFGDRIAVGSATIQFESAVAVPRHAAAAASTPITVEDDVPAAPLEPEPAGDVSTTPPPSMPFGLVAATDHPLAHVLTDAEGPASAAGASIADRAASLALDPLPLDPSAGEPLAEPLPGTDLPDEKPPLPQPRSWDAVDVNDPPPGVAPVAEVPPAPPEPHPRAWGDALPMPLADEDPVGHGVAGLVPAEANDQVVPIAEPAPIELDLSEVAPSTESVAGVDHAVLEAPADEAVVGHGVAELVPSEPEPLSFEPAPVVDHEAATHEPIALDAEHDVLPPTDVVEPTEPSPDSALAWEAEVAGAGEPAAEPALDESLSDSQFGRQVDEFVAADTTGPLVEASAPAEAVVPVEAPDVHPGLPAAEVAPVEPAHPAPFVPPANLLEDVSDFVFVPGDATADADVIFWGDDELDAVTAAAIGTAPPVAAPPVAIEAATAEAEVSADPIAAATESEPSGGWTDAGSVPQGAERHDVEPPVAPVATEATPAEAVVAEEAAAEATEFEPFGEMTEAASVPHAAEPRVAEATDGESPVDMAAVVTEGVPDTADALDVADEAPAAEHLHADVAFPADAEPVDSAAVDELELSGEFAAHGDAASEEESPVDLTEGGETRSAVAAHDAEPEMAVPDDEAAAPSLDWVEVPEVAEATDVAAPDAPLPIAAADSLSAGPFTEEPSVDLSSLTGDGPSSAADDVSAEASDAFLAEEPHAVAPEPVAEPHLSLDEADAALAVAAPDEHGADDAAIGFDDLLAHVGPGAEGAASADHVTQSATDHGLTSGVVASDEPVGFEWDADGTVEVEPAHVEPVEAEAGHHPTDASASVDWDDLDLLDAPTSAVEPAPAALAEADGLTADEAHAPSTGGHYGAVVNVAEGLVAGLSTAGSMAAEALAPVSDFSAVGDGAPVDSFAAVTDAALAAPHAGSAVADDDLAFLDFEPDEEASGFLGDDLSPEAVVPATDHGAQADIALDEVPAETAEELPLGEPVPPPADAVAEVSDEALPSTPPELVETVTEPTVDIAPPVEDPPLQLLASVSIPPPPEAPPARPPMSGPSLFGFNFEGGSFLGGMPLPLNSPDPAPPLSPVGITFDTPTPELPSAAEEPADLEPKHGAVDELPGATEDDGSPARVRPVAPPPTLGLIGLVGAAAAEAATARPVLPAGLMTHGAAAGRQLPPPPVPPKGFADIGNGRSRSADVFSQAAGPIGVVEAFGTRPGRAEQYDIPEVDRSAQPGTAQLGPSQAGGRGDALPPPPGQRLANAERLVPVAAPKRKKIRWLIYSFFLLPVGWTALVYLSMSKSATVKGVLRFDGLDAQGQSAQRLFKGDQVTRLCGDDVRATARAMLVQRGKPTGPTEDAPAMVQAMQEPMKVSWTGGDMEVDYTVRDGDAGKAQVEALLSALRAKDEEMSDARARAQKELADATAAFNAAKDARDALKRDHDKQVKLGEDRPDKATVDALERDQEAANKKVASVQAERAATESVLAGWQKQDPSKPVDPAIDPEATNLQRQLVPIQAQIAKAKQLREMNGGGNGAAGDDDPLMAVLQQQADRLQAMLERRQTELQREAAFPPEERARARETEIEKLGVKVAALKKQEADAIAAAAAATDKVDRAHAQVDTARQAENFAQDTYTKLQDAEVALNDRRKDLDDKLNELKGTVIVAGSASTNPDVPTPAESDPRPWTALGGAAVIMLIIFLWALAVAGTGEDPADDVAYGDPEADREVSAPSRGNREPVGV